MTWVFSRFGEMSERKESKESKWYWGLLPKEENISSLTIEHFLSSSKSRSGKPYIGKQRIVVFLKGLHSLRETYDGKLGVTEGVANFSLGRYAETFFQLAVKLVSHSSFISFPLLMLKPLGINLCPFSKTNEEILGWTSNY